MNWKSYLLIILISSAALVAVSVFQAVPGYMDAEYYYSMGLRIAKYNTFSEPFIWNYLSGAKAIPHPGFMYWMPLPALLAAAGMLVSGVHSFAAARAGSILLAAIVPAIVMGSGYRLTRNRSASWLAGALAVFPAFYNVFTGTTDSFGIMMVLGGFFLLIALEEKSWASFLAIGLLAGLMHLARPDGFFWLAGGFLLVWKSDYDKRRAAASLIAGYLLVMAPWFVRNLLVTGEILPGASSRVLWLRDYNELFLFNYDELNIKNWLSQGFRAILSGLGAAAWANIKTLLFVQGQLILFPFMVLGLKECWKNKAVRVLVLVWGLVFLLMSFVFPFAGMRGGYLHSGAGFQPLFWVLAAAGFLWLVQLGAEKRDWEVAKAQGLFGASLVVILLLGSGYIFVDRVIGPNPGNPRWGASDWAARNIDKTMQEYGLDGLAMINNPPGFYSATERESIVIPSGGIAEVMQAAETFGAEYLVLEANHPASLKTLYLDPDQLPGLELITSRASVRYFRIIKE